MIKHIQKGGKHSGPLMLLMLLYISPNLMPGAANGSGYPLCEPNCSHISRFFAQVSDRIENKNTTDGTEKNSPASDDDESTEKTIPTGGARDQDKEEKSYKQFSPSERIEVDQAVDFPADI